MKASQLHHKKGHKISHHKKHHIHAQASEAPAKPVPTATDKGTNMKEDEDNEAEVGAAKKEMEDAAKRKQEEEAREAARK